MLRPRLALLLLAAVPSSAHLDSLLTPKSGIGYPAGSSVIVRWTIGNNHNGIDVHLSTDDKTWTTLVSDLAKTTTAWSWAVPSNLRSERTRIRVCQKSGPQGCTDADSVSNPSDGPLYTLVSGRFRVEAGTTRLDAPRPAAHLPLPMLTLEEGFRIVRAPAVGRPPHAFDLRGQRIPLLRMH
jgi:hypothetical protein